MVEVLDQFDFGVEQLQQQAIAVAQVIGVFGAGGVFQQCNATQAELGGQRGGLADMVGLNGAGSHQRVGTLREGIGGQVFKFAQLVAAHGQRCGVIAFDVDIPAQPGRQPLKFFQGSGAAQQFQAVKAVELLFDHGYAQWLSDGATIGRHFSTGNPSIAYVG